jgi:ribosome-associated translation inhibitor RaiA
MTSLPIHITTHHLSLSDSLRLFARKKIAAVTRFANDALGAEIVLRRHGGAATRFSASARIALPGRDIHGRAVHSNLTLLLESSSRNLLVSLESERRDSPKASITPDAAKLPRKSRRRLMSRKFSLSHRT